MNVLARTTIRLTTCALAALLLGALGPAAAAQAAGKKPPPDGGPSVFTPPGGGQYTPPGDAGGDVGGDEGGSGGDSSDDKSKGGASAPPATGQAQPGGGETGSGPSRGSGSRGSLDSLADGATAADSWDQWWETNKFDFIELRRIEDAPSTPQGSGRESAADRELRLAGVRSHLREGVLPVLRELMTSPDDAVRGAAAVALAKLRDDESLDEMAALLGDGNNNVRRAGMLALGVIGNGRGTWMLLHVAGDSPSGRKLLGSSSIGIEDRGTALVASALRGEAAGTQLLLQILSERKGTPDELLALAAGAAGLLGSTDAIRPLIDIAFDKNLPEHVRSAATSALGRIGDPSVTPALMELLGFGLEPRRAATLALGQVAHPGATKVIEKLASLIEHDEDAPTRHFAAVALGRIGGDAARTALLVVLGKAKDDMRPWVELGLGLCERRSPSAESSAALLARLPKDNASTRGALYIALGLSRSDAALPELVKGLTNPSSNLAASAAMALGLSGQTGARAPLRDVLSVSKDPALLRSTALALGILGDTASIPALLDLIRRTSNPFVASFAAIGVAFMGDADAAVPLVDLIRRQGPSGVTTTWAVAAVGQLFDQDRRPALARLAADDNYLVRPSAVANLLDLGY